MANAFLDSYIQGAEQSRRSDLAAMQERSAAIQNAGALQQLQSSQNLKDALAKSGGDPEKALAIALQSGDTTAASHLAPLVKMRQEQRQREQTAAGLAKIYGQQPPNAATPPPNTPAPDGSPTAPQPLTPDMNPKAMRIEQLKKTAQLYAGNPAVFASYQREIDKLEAESKPMVEHNFPVMGGKEPMVQPHISLDNGKTWKPIAGSQPTPKFAKQIVNVNTGGEPVTATDDTLRMDAYGYLTDNKLPTNMGRGIQGAAQATKIRNEASRIAKEELKMPLEDVRMMGMVNKAGLSALIQNTKDLAAIRPYEQMLTKNADIAVNLAEKVIKTDVKLANKPINWVRQNLGDNPDAAEFLAQTRIVTTEAARVLNNPRLTGQLTDNARHEMEQIVSGDMPLNSFVRVVRRMQSDGRNRVEAMEKENAALKGGLKVSSRAPAEPASPAPAGKVVDFGSLK